MNENLRGLAADYYEALRGVRELKAKAKKRREAGNADLIILSSMEKDLEWVIEYMMTGYMPSDRKRHRKASIAYIQKGF